MRYHTRIEGGDEQVVELTAEGVRLDGDAVEAELAAVPGEEGLRHLRLGDRGFRLHAARTENGWEITIAGCTISVRVEDERTRRIREMAGEELQSGGAGEVLAPMPGMVVRLLVEEGQEVEPGTPLLIMEAMKMENELRTQQAGVVSRIRVDEGETVSQDAVLVVLEESSGGEP